MLKDKKIVVCINNAGKSFFYNGTVTEEDEHFLTIRDQKEGILQISKSVIISIKVCDD